MQDADRRGVRARPRNGNEFATERAAFARRTRHLVAWGSRVRYAVGGSACAALIAFGCGGGGSSHANDPNPPNGSNTAGASNGSNSAGGSAGAGAMNGATTGAGVVSQGACVPLCRDGSTDPDGDGWGYEQQMSCIVPGSTQAASRVPCTVGAPVPTQVGPAPGSAGVVVNSMCVGICGPAILDDDPALADDLTDGWGWEFEASCVIPGSATALTSLACKTGAAVPVVDRKGDAGRLLDGVCSPFCKSSSADPDGDGFGFEFGANCVVTGSIPATAVGIDCVVGSDDLIPPVVLNPNPPPGMLQKPAEVLSRGFFVRAGKLYDKFGNAFILRGVNNPHIWFDASNQWFAYHALDDIARYGANTVRIVWETNGSAENLARVIRRVVELHMIPMLELHDVTGGTTNPSLLLMASYYMRGDVKAVLLAYEDFLLLNIANEWSGMDFSGAYGTAVSELRAAGLNHTLVIDSNGFGQNADTVLTQGGALLTADPQHNLLFSVHMYDQYAATDMGRARITSTLAQAQTLGLPLIVGEFGWQAPSGAAVDIDLIMSECARLGVGYLAWSWFGNDANLAFLDMVTAWGGPLTTWGGNVVQGPNGITQTAKPASIFGL